MLDTTNFTTNLTMTLDWRDHLSYGDIVSFRFPLADKGHTGTPKARPGLVLDIETRGDQRYALHAYGTTSRRRSNVGYEIHVRRRADYLFARLNEPTRFVGARHLPMSLGHGGFITCHVTGAPVPGRLSGSSFKAMNAVGGRIHVEGDIAAERRGRHTETRPRGRPFRPPFLSGKGVRA